ncbi:MAG: trypsin-like peptidase domain-containing protein [Verrucomicrobiales bacterium]|nr:trypsin-like peptidase domain-containing protein [Verrucomicrobiales bacterium]
MKTNLILGTALLIIAGNLNAAELRVKGGFLPGGIIDDRKLLSEINLKTIELRDTKDGAVKSAELLKQLKRLDRKKCDIQLAPVGKQRLTAAETVTRARKGVLVVSGLYKCKRCPNWHSGAASGFMLTTDGVFCTSYHVVDNLDNDILVIMTGNGRMAPVVEVLAADKTADIAILRAKGKGFTALPVSTEAPLGGKVRVLSHPDRHFYVLSEGIISRKYLDTPRNGGRRQMFSITADFAKGSSGAPVLNEYGAVIGSVNNTQSTYYSVKNGVKDNLQMVFKNTVSMQHLLNLIQPKKNEKR